MRCANLKDAAQTPVAREDKALSLSEKIWNFRWRDYFPREISPGIRADRIGFDDGAAIIARIFPEVYKLSDQFFEEDPQGFRARYYREAGDFFLLSDTEENNAPVGIGIGSLLDWSSYNFRNMAILPAWQGRGSYVRFLELMSSVLRDKGVQRIEGDVSPSNQRHIGILTKMGWNVTSFSISERWGALVHMTKYLDERSEERLGKLYSLSYPSDVEKRLKQKCGSKA